MAPPIPQFAFAVAIIGHRPNRLPEAALPFINRAVADALDALKRCAEATRRRYPGCFANSASGITLVSGIAEGADTIAAKAAFAIGYALDVILPFGRDEYEADFAEAHKQVFRSLLGKARSVIELSGTRANEGKSYDASGIAILDASDVLLTVWDGGTSAGRGGTTELVAEAGRRGMPIIHVDANGKAPTRILWQGLQAKQKISRHIGDYPSAPLDETIDLVMDSLLRPPPSVDETAGLVRFLTEPSPSWLLRQSFPLLMAAFLVRWPRWTDWRPASPGDLAETVAADVPGSPGVLATAYGWADAVSVHFSQKFRSTFVDNFLFSALAILVAAMSLLVGPEWLLAVIELVLILWILINTRTGLKRHWHQRWVEPREVAERLRIALPMTLLGTRPLGPYGEAPTWTSWYVRALVRQVGIVSGRLDCERLHQCRVALEKLLASQSNYHRRTARRFSTLNRRIRLASELLLFATLAAVLVHLLSGFPGLIWPTGARHQLVDETMVALSTVLPAMGAALFGIRTIGDFDGTAKRAGRMHAELAGLAKTLATLPDDHQALRAFALLTSDVMLGDVASWRLSAESRELSVPG